MLIYKDVISGDELCSDSYPMKLVDDIVYEFDGKTITFTNGVSDEAIGGNKSQEDGGDEGLDDGSVTEINIVYGNRLKETSFGKKDYLTYIKGYMKKILSILKEKNPDRVPVFQSKAEKYIKEMIKNFDNYRFFTGESMDVDGMVVLMDYREDQITPYFILFKDGLEEMKM